MTWARTLGIGLGAPLLGAAGASACSMTDLDDLRVPSSDTALDDAQPSPTPTDASPDAPADADVDVYAPPLPDAAKPFDLPPQGTFEYEQHSGKAPNDVMTGKGSSGPVATPRAQAQTLSATLSYLAKSDDGSCWKLQITVHPSDANGRRTDEETFCTRPNGIAAPAVGDAWKLTETWPSLPIVSTTTSATCTQPVSYLNWGSSPPWPYQGSGSLVSDYKASPYTFQGTSTFLGTDTVSFGATTEDVYRVQRTHALTGNVSGSETVAFFMSTKDALPLRIVRSRHITVAYNQPPITSFDFDEDSDWVIKARPNGTPP